MISSAHQVSTLHLRIDPRLELQRKADPEFDLWFRSQYRPLAGGWQY
jgi:hypothetical protein